MQRHLEVNPGRPRPPARPCSRASDDAASAAAPYTAKAATEPSPSGNRRGAGMNGKIRCVHRYHKRRDVDEAVWAAI